MTVLVFHTSFRSSWNEMQDGIYRYARAHGWNVFVAEHKMDREAVADVLAFWRPDGVIVEGAMDEAGVFLPDVFGDVPVVYLVCDHRHLSSEALCVNHDSRSFGRVAAREFLSMGLASFAFFGFAGLFWSAERAARFREVLRLAGRELALFERPFLEHDWRDLSTGFTQSFGAWLKSLPKPCGLLAANDQLGAETISTCRALGLAVPDDVLVLGIDNDESLCEHVSPTLSSIRPNFEEAGFQAASLLDARRTAGGAFAGDRQRFFAADGLVRRQSTRRLPRANAVVSKALELVRLRACSGLRPRDVFAELGCSRRTAELRFRELAGHSIQEEILLTRLARVKQLLSREDVPVETIARRCGWKSTAQLRVFFKATEGVSMRQWRRARLESCTP